MKTYLNKPVSTRVVVYSLLGVFALYALFFSPGAIQSRNMKRAASIKDDILTYISHDEIYSQVRIVVGTTNLGRDLYIMGQVPTEESLDSLKETINANYQDDVIEMRFMVRVISQEE